MQYPDTIQNLIECFKKYPGVGTKSAERYALATLSLDKDIQRLLAQSVIDCGEKIKKCSKCNNYTENDLCKICLDKTRNKDLICIVEDPRNIIQLENTHIFDGYYHVLKGLISPLEGIEPEDLELDKLVQRIKDDNVKEVIIAVKPSIEGETTALYISKILESENVVVSRIAQGVPLGADIDYVDSLTLELALENRKKLN